MTTEKNEVRNARGQLLVSYPEWVDISTVADQAGVSRYHGYLIIKDLHSCQRVEFTNHPDPNRRIDLAAEGMQAATAIEAYKARQRQKVEREEIQQKRRAEARAALPEKRRLIGEAREKRNNARRDLTSLRVGIKNEIAKRRGERHSQHNADLRRSINDTNASRNNAQESYEEQAEQLAEFNQMETATIQAEYERVVAALEDKLEVDIDEMDDEVEAENAKRILALESIIAQQQAEIDRLSEER